LCHFADTPDGTRTLVAFGRRVEGAVQAILMESAVPLHFSDITPLATERMGRAEDVRRAHNAAAVVGILLGRGTYGSERHIPLDNEEREELCATVEAIIESGEAGRQWHAS